VDQKKNTRNVVGLNMDNLFKEDSKIKLIFKKIFFPSRNYLRSLFPYFLFTILIFLVGILLGFYFAEEFPLESQKFISLLKETYEPILEMNKVSQILFIFLQNSFVSFLAIITGFIFGIFPFLVLLFNGEAIGVVASFILRDFNISYFLLGILPHGIIEIPCILISCAMGLKIWIILVRKIFKRDERSLKDEISLASEIFLKVILVLLLMAAIIEVLVIPELLRII